MKPRKPFYFDSLYCCKCRKRYPIQRFNGSRPMCPIHHIFLRAKPRQRKWKEKLKEKQTSYRILQIKNLVNSFSKEIGRIKKNEERIKAN